MSEPRFFSNDEEFGAWLAAHHATERELLVGFHKRATGRASLTWEQSVEQALRFGWIDGVRRSLGTEAFAIRFTPRRPRSVWSLVNVAIAERLIAEGRMAPAGSAAFAARDPARTGVYAFEQQQDATLDDAERARFEADAAAWADFCGRPAGYRRAALHWVTSAKRPETRARRLEQLIAASTAGEHVAPLRPRRGPA